MIKVGSLYSGIGGICLGFRNNGCDIAWANEFDTNACKTYRLNFKHNLIESDVHKIDISKLENVDIITAGYPCQPFSLAGKLKGFSDHRGNHFFKVMEIVNILKPRCIFFENVKNLLSHDKGNTIKIIEKSLSDSGYFFKYDILNTKDYGNIPQNRERIYIVAFSNENSFLNFRFPGKIKLENKISDLITKDKVEEKFYYTEGKYKLKNYEEILNIKNKESVYHWRRYYIRENKNNVCPTLTANMGTGGHNVPIILTEHGVRKLTPLECLRFQGFPENYILPDLASSHIYKQAGNSVSVPVIERIAKNILDVL